MLDVFHVSLQDGNLVMYKRDSPYGVIWASNTQNAGKGPYQFFLWVSDEYGKYIQYGKDHNLVSSPMDTSRYTYYTFYVVAKTEPSEHIFIG